MKYLLSIIFVMSLSAFVSAQEIIKNNSKITALPGTISGEIIIKEWSGNGLSKFTCSNLIVSAGKREGFRQRKGRASGDISKRRCIFTVPSIPSGESFVAVLNADMPGCDQKAFETTTSFPMTLKPGQALKYNFEVIKIKCVLLK